MNNERDMLKEAVQRISKPIFNKVLQETFKNHMLVGRVGFKRRAFCFYNAHNYRLYFDFSRVNFDVEKVVKPRVGNEGGRLSVSYGVSIINKTEIMFKGYHGCNIRVRSKTVEVVNLLDHKKQHIIYLGDGKRIEAQFREITEKKALECVEALKLFIEEFGGRSSFKLLNFHSENKIINEEKINLMPLKMKFHNDMVKKVYNEKNVEFSTPASASNYLTNRGLEDFSPVIADRLKAIEDKIKPLEVKVRKEEEKIIDYLEDVSLFDEGGFNRAYFLKG